MTSEAVSGVLRCSSCGSCVYPVDRDHWMDQVKAYDELRKLCLAQRHVPQPVWSKQ